MFWESIFSGFWPGRSSRRANYRQAGRWFWCESLEDRRLLAFAPAVDYPVGDSPQAVVSADFNGDGRLDLAVANYLSHSVSVLLGNANGTFQPALTSPTGANPRSLAVGDFNSDGKLDVATANAGDVSVLLGNGDGTFGAPRSLSLGFGEQPASVAVGDFNADGKLDLGVTANTYYGFWYGYYGTANVLLGNGDGSFSAPSWNFLEWGWHNSAVVADFNGDGKHDFAAANSDYWTVSVLLGDGTGNLIYGQSWFPTGAYPSSVAAGDVNGDLKTDLVTANYYGNSVSVLLGNGTGGFAAAQTYAVGSGPTSVVIGDFNGDGRVDIATANSAGNDLSVLYGRPDGTFSAPLNIATVPGAYALAVGDFNGDGWLDVAAASPNGDQVSVLLNDQTWPAAPASLSIDDVTVTEGDSGTVAAVFTVTRSGEDLSGTATVNYSTANGDALAGSDYVAKSGTLTFAPGVATMTITILVNGDLIDEYDQSFYVNLSAASGAVIADGQGVGTIVDDDPPPTITITPKVSAREGNNNSTTWFNFVVTLSAPSEKYISVSFATANGTATTADNDYVAKSGTLAFAPGVTSQTISVQVKGDKKKESNEVFYVNLSSAINATIAAAQGIGEILDDDTPPGKQKNAGKPT
jgi:hypothetical protein